MLAVFPQVRSRLRRWSPPAMGRRLQHYTVRVEADSRPTLSRNPWLATAICLRRCAGLPCRRQHPRNPKSHEAVRVERSPHSCMSLWDHLIGSTPRLCIGFEQITICGAMGKSPRIIAVYPNQGNHHPVQGSFSWSPFRCCLCSRRLFRRDQPCPPLYPR